MRGSSFPELKKQGSGRNMVHVAAWGVVLVLFQLSFFSFSMCSILIYGIDSAYKRPGYDVLVWLFI